MYELSPNDLSTYLNRLSYEAPPPPTLATLQELQLRHTCAFSFETLSTMLHDAVPLDIPALKAKILYGGRGGYCYELNKLYLELLQELGYSVRGITARVVMGGPPDAWAPRMHMLVLVEIDGRAYVTDVGFGGLVPTAPLRLGVRDVQETPHEPYRISEQDGAYTVWVQVVGEWRALFVFDLQRQGEVDYEMGNWYVSTHKDSPFIDQLVAARMSEGVRRTLENGSYAVHRTGFATDRRQITDVDELISVMEREFQIRMPSHPELRPVLTKLLRIQP